eukprot:1501870-Alexandrium_andersonii.AAC.1
MQPYWVEQGPGARNAPPEDDIAVRVTSPEVHANTTSCAGCLGGLNGSLFTTRSRTFAQNELSSPRSHGPLTLPAHTACPDHMYRAT